MPLVFGEFTLDDERRLLLRTGVPISLEPKAYELLSLLLARRPRALSKDQIHEVLWAGTFVSESALAGLVADLRSVLGDNARRPRYIRTVHGFGYAFCGDARAGGEPAAEVKGPVLRTLSLSRAGAQRSFDRPFAALTAALDDRAGVAVHVSEVAAGSRPPVVLQQLASLVQPTQVLLSRAAFDLARDAADGEGHGLVWLAHGPYLFDGMREPIDVFEVGRPGESLLKPPPDTNGARRAVRPGDETTLGWRPAAGLRVPGRDEWTFVDKLGEGGFGEVWLAAHPSGERRVFKFCFDAARLRGLKREATLFRLLKDELGDRDDIAKVLDWNFDEPPYFLESEYTEGGSLVDWSKAAGGIGAIALDTRLQLIAQIAEALAAAHSVGVLHKDVKPQNVLITEDAEGKPKARLTDFGVGIVRDKSLLLGRDFTVTGFTESIDDGSRRWTGTRLYAAPEVLEGKTPTTLADIYALGVMLYQVVVGDFDRALAPGWEADVSDDLLRDDISACVHGRPERRIGNALQLVDRLRNLEQRRAENRAPRRTYRELLAWTLLTLIGVAAFVLAVVHFRETPAERSYQFSLVPPDNSTFIGPVSVSPDGHRVAVVVSSAGGTMLWIRRLDSPNAQPLQGTEGADGPFWSPDSQFIGFFAVGKLKTIDSAGGPAQTVCDAPNGSFGTWSGNGVIVFAPDRWGAPLYRVPAAGGAPTVILEPKTPQEGAYLSPQFLPDGRHFLYFMQGPQPLSNGIYVGSLDSKDTKWILNTPWIARYAPAGAGGHGDLLFLRDGTLMAQPFDTNRLQLAGQPAAVTETIVTKDPYGRAFFSASDNGVLVYASNRGQSSPLRLVWVDRQGKSRPLSAPSGLYEYPRISPDGQRIAVQIYSGVASDVWIYDLGRADFSRLTYDGTNTFSSVVWAPDSKRVVFSSRRHGPQNMYIQDAGGSSPAERILPGPNWAVPNSWSRDGRTLIFVYLAPISNDPGAIPITGQNGEIWAMSLAGRKAHPLLRGPLRHWQGMLSPDGRWLAYVSDESGRFEVYVTSFPSLQGRWQISTDGGGEVRWAPNGRELFWRTYDQMMAASVSTQAGFSASKPKVLFGDYMVGPPGIPDYDVAPDGQRFLMLQEAETPPEKTEMNVVVNWSASSRSGSGIGSNK